MKKNKKLYEKRIYICKLSGKYWYTAEARRLGFLWRGKWKEVSPALQPNYESAEKLLNDLSI